MVYVLSIPPAAGALVLDDESGSVAAVVGGVDVVTGAVVMVVVEEPDGIESSLVVDVVLVEGSPDASGCGASDTLSRTAPTAAEAMRMLTIAAAIQAATSAVVRLMNPSWYTSRSWGLTER